MANEREDIDWHLIYSGSGSVSGGSWFEEVAYLGKGEWVVRIYDDPAWTFDAEGPMEPEEKSSDEIVEWVWSLDSASEEDSSSLPRGRALLEVATSVGDEAVATRLRRSLAQAELDRMESCEALPFQDVTLIIGPPGSPEQKNRMAQLAGDAGETEEAAWQRYVHTVIRSLLEVDAGESRSKFDELLSKVIGQPAKVAQPFLGTAMLGGNTLPTLMILANSITPEDDEFEGVTFSAESSVLASVLGDLLQAEWVRGC